MFRLFDTGAHELALLKTNVKKWEYLLYGGRTEVYPQDRKAMLTLLQYKQQRIEKEQKHAQAKEKMAQKMKSGLSAGETGG
jgi:hypothetical protein